MKATDGRGSSSRTVWRAGQLSGDYRANPSHFRALPSGGTHSKHHFDSSLFLAIASYLAWRAHETDAKRLTNIITPSDKVKLYTDRIKQMSKFKAWFFTLLKPKSQSPRL